MKQECTTIFSYDKNKPPDQNVKSIVFYNDLEKSFQDGIIYKNKRANDLDDNQCKEDVIFQSITLNNRNQ